MSRRPLALLLFAFATRAAPARSTEAPRLSRLAVSIEGDACSSALVDEVLYLAKIELRNQLVDSPAGADCRVTISCAASRVAVVARADGKARAHETDLSEVSESLRPRVVALAIAELVHEIEITDVEPPRVEPPRVPNEAPIEIPRAAPRRVIALSAFAHASSFRLDQKWLLGGGIGATFGRGRFLTGIDAAIATRDEHFATGTAHVLLTYVAPQLGLRATAGRFGAELGAGFALGVAHITGETTDPQANGERLTEFWGAPFAFSGVAYAASDSISIGLRGHAGWVTLPVVGLVWKGPTVDLKGFWTGAQIGVTLAL